MNGSIYTQRTEKLVRRLETGSESPCDGAWIIKPENRRYLSGFSAEDGQFTESSGSLLISGTNRLLITDSRYTLAAGNEAKNFTVYTIKKSFVEDIPDFAQNLFLAHLGFEEDYLTWDLYRRASEKLAAFSPAGRLDPAKRCGGRHA